VSSSTVAELGNDPLFHRHRAVGQRCLDRERRWPFYDAAQRRRADGVRVRAAHDRRAVAEQSYPSSISRWRCLHYGMGFMLGGEWLSFYGPDTMNAFGHIGFINVMGWADPDRQISVGFTNSGKPLLYPEISAFSDIFKQIGLACPKEPGYDWLATLSRPRARQSTRSKSAVPPPEATIH
jgi:CubicO group peptidase (beta-lactamase class C family)